MTRWTANTRTKSFTNATILPFLRLSIELSDSAFDCEVAQFSEAPPAPDDDLNETSVYCTSSAQRHSHTPSGQDASREGAEDTKNMNKEHFVYQGP